MRKAGLAALVTLASVALALPDRAEAHGYVGGQVVIQSPVAVFGFSYGNPFAVGHVHYGPAYCNHGPLYYYPSHQVYGHYHPGYRYTRYASPRYVKVASHHGHRHHASWNGRSWNGHSGKGHSGHGKAIRGHGGHKHKGNKGRH